MRKKKVIDIQEKDDFSPIDLGGRRHFKKIKEENRLKKQKNTLYKSETPIQEVKDLSGQKKAEYLYLRGKTFKVPRYFGSIMKIGGIGLIILLILNGVSVYMSGKQLQEEITNQAYEGYSHLIDAGKSATKVQFAEALEIFEKARENFSDAENKLWFINTDNTFFSLQSHQIQAVKALLEAGEHFAIAGGYFIEAIDHFNKIPIYFVTKNRTQNAGNPSITDTLAAGLEKTNLAVAEISLAAEKISTINEEILPTTIQVRVAFAKNQIQEIANLLKSTSAHFPAILKLMGDRYPHRYLVLLQNNNEIRPSGGFIGSYAIIDVNDGYIENIEVFDSYDIDGTFGGFIEPPEEFKAFTGNWRFRDSNYSSDFAVSAQKARWFLQKEGGPSVDTVIAINQGLLKDMLEITGPIQVGEFGELDSKNYNLLLSYVIEGKVWGEEDPKHILKVFIPAFKEAILKEENLSKLMSKLYRAIQQKHVLMYSSDNDIQNLFEAFDLSGTSYVPKEKEDFLSVINISINGTKSEQFMEEVITHKTFINSSGVLTDEITLERSHLWTDEIYLEWKKILKEYGFEDMPDPIIDILGRGENRVYTKIYVPKDSILLESDYEDVVTEYDKDLKKTYFLVKINTKPGETSKLTISYQLPFTLSLNEIDTYKLFIEKQPGSRGSIFTKKVVTDEGIQSLAVYPPETEVYENGDTVYATNLVYDKYFSGVWQK